MNVYCFGFLILLGASSLARATPDSGTETRQFLRLFDLPFDRGNCEDFVLGPAGIEGRKKHVAWLKTWENIPFVPTNRVRRYLRKQDTDPGFKVAMAPRQTSKEELERIYRLAEVEVHRLTSDVARFVAAGATPLTALERRALGIGASSETVSENLEVKWIRRDGSTLLQTRDGSRVIGEMAFDLNALEIGWIGTPEFWIYEQALAGEKIEELEVADFIAQHSVSILQPKDRSYPFVWVLAIHDDPGTDELEQITLDLFWESRVHPAVADDGDVRVPPLVRDGLSSKFRFMGLGLSTTIDL